MASETTDSRKENNNELVHVSPNSKLKKQLDFAKEQMSAVQSVMSEESELPKTKVLLAYDRVFVPAKKPKDQPLIRYHIDSDDETDQFLPYSKSNDRMPKQSSATDDPFEIDFNVDIDSDSESGNDLDLIPLNRSSEQRRRPVNCCNTVTRCVILTIYMGLFSMYLSVVMIY